MGQSQGVRAVNWIIAAVAVAVELAVLRVLYVTFLGNRG
jgi:hypothetical protein